MKLDRIVAETDTSSGEIGAIQHSLVMLAAGLDVRFVMAGDTLAGLIDGLDRVIGSLDAIIGAMDAQSAGAAVASLRASAGRLLALPPLQDGRIDDLATVRRSAMEVDSHVMGIREILRILRVNGTNLGIATGGAGEFSPFITGMFARLDSGDEHFGAIVARLRDLLAAVANSQRSARLVASECAKVIPLVPERLADDALELQAHQAVVAAAAQGVRSTAREIHGRVAIILGALQIGDISRQRLEHVAAALQLVAGETQAQARAYVLDLLVEQLETIAADLDAEALLLVKSLRALGPDLKHLLALLESCEAGEGSYAFIHRLERGITEVEALTRQLREANRQTVTMSLAIADAMDELGERLERVRGVRSDIRQIATGAQQLGQQFGNAGRAIASVADEVAGCTDALDRAVNGVAWAMRELATTSLSIRHRNAEAGAADPSRQLTQSLTLIRDACRRAELRLSEGGLDARELIDSVVEAAERVRSDLEIGGTIAEVARRLRAEAPAKPSLSDEGEAATRQLLLRVEALYTMAREREVHRRHLLPGMTLAASDIGDDDDGLF